jgi:hypothetical protein
MVVKVLVLLVIHTMKRTCGALARDGRTTLDQVAIQAVPKELGDLIGLEENDTITAEN